MRADPRGAEKIENSKITCSVRVGAGAQHRITPVSVDRRVARKDEAVPTCNAYENLDHWIMGKLG